MTAFARRAASLDIHRSNHQRRLSALLATCDALPDPEPGYRNGCFIGRSTVGAAKTVARALLNLDAPPIGEMLRAEDQLRRVFNLSA